MGRWVIVTVNGKQWPTPAQKVLLWIAVVVAFYLWSQVHWTGSLAIALLAWWALLWVLPRAVYRQIRKYYRCVQERRQLAARADVQHTQVLDGDPQGMFGLDPPARPGGSIVIPPTRLPD
jgi:hypothetical protein